MTEQRLAKGVNVRDIVKLIRHHRQTDLPGIDDDTGELLLQPIMPTSWYPLAQFLSLLELAHVQILGGSDEAAIEMGRATARGMLRGAHAPYLAADPQRTLAAFTRAWPAYFNFAEVAVEPLGDQGAVVRITGYTDMGRCHGHTIVGWMQEAVDLSGAAEVEFEIRAAPWRGDDTLELAFAWESAQG